MRPLLSVCLIARNEEASLPRVLRSVREVADEIVVADTGSTDGTERVAKEHGATVCHFPWCDDFGAAFNFVAGQARGEWILRLDADEELLPESIDELRTCILRKEALAYFIRSQDLKQSDRLDYYSVMSKLRLFRNRDDLRLQGRCHPQFRPTLEEVGDRTGLRVYHSTIAMRHFGYVGELRPAKLQRALRLLELELRDRPGQLYYLIEYGRTLLMLGDEHGHEVLCQAAAQIIPQIKQERAPLPSVAMLLEYLLQMPAERLPAGLTSDLVKDLVQRWFPSYPPLSWLLACQAASAGQFGESERLLRRLIQMGIDHNYDQSISFDPRFIGSDARLNLGVCLVRQSRLAEARSIFTELLASPDRAAEARDYLRVIDQFLEQTGTGRVSYSFGPEA